MQPSVIFSITERENRDPGNTEYYCNIWLKSKSSMLFLM